MKNKYLIICVLLIFLIAFWLYLIKPKNYFYQINYDDIETIINNKDSGIIVIGRENCPYCEDLIEQIKRDIDNKKQNVYYFEMMAGDMAKKDEIQKKYGYFEYVPHILYFDNHKIFKMKKSEEGVNIYDNFWIDEEETKK